MCLICKAQHVEMSFVIKFDWFIDTINEKLVAEVYFNQFVAKNRLKWLELGYNWGHVTGLHQDC